MKLLLGYDGSICADAAIDDLRRAGLPKTGDAIVLSVGNVWPHLAQIPMPGTGPGLDDWTLPAFEQVRQASELELARAKDLAAQGAKRLESVLPDWKITAEAAADSPRAAIVKRADAWAPDLVVVGSHGRSALGRLFLGSVSHSVLTHCRSTVRVGRAPRHQSEGVRLLVGIDGSAGSSAAVAEVSSRKWPAGSEARVITVIDSAISTALPVQSLEIGWLPVRYESTQQWVAHAARRAAHLLREAGLEATHQVCTGDPKEMLINEAEKWGADCIFLAQKGLSRLERFLVGSVSSAVATRAHCSVEIVK